MLEDITIKDFAIIDCITIDFSNGFTVLSGETGAGKSILIGALSFLLGGRADLSQIRAGAKEASVTATFYLKSLNGHSSAKDWLDEHGIETENERIILRRYVRDSGKSGAWIGSTPVTKSDLSEFSSFLIDIHGQHEHQSLMKVSEHRKFLDARAGITEEVNAFSKMYLELVEKRHLLTQLILDSGERQNKIDMLSYAIDEISSAKLKPREDEELMEEEARLASYEKLYEGIQKVKEFLDSSDSGALQLIKKARRESSNAALLDKTLSDLDERLESSFYELSDISAEFDNYSSKLVYDPVHLSEIQERLSIIFNLKKKYASSQSAKLQEVFDYASNAALQLDRLGGGAENAAALKNEIETLEKKVYIAAKSISEKRKTLGKRLASEVQEILKSLGMTSAIFGVDVKEKAGNDVEQRCGPYGMDDIEFMISANVGSPLQPLAKIASGGELSRVMLALKTIFAETDEVETLVFDEIDTGIGGEIAVAVGNHIKNLAKNHQIFCITHLASIAVYADNQIKIEKQAVDGKTASSVYAVEGAQRVLEIARMLSGDVQSEQSLEHAKAMLEKFSGGIYG